MAVKKTILDDPRYDEFVERYHADPLRFAVEVADFSPSEDQEELLLEIADPTAKVSVVSGTGTGKTATFARIALWHLLAHPVAIYEGKIEIGSNTYIGAPRVAQVSDGIWKELQDAKIAIQNSPCAWIGDYFTIGKTRVTVNGFDKQWFIAQLAMAPGASVGVAGKHRFWQLIIVDEAAGVTDPHFDVIDGTQTQGGNRTLIASQGVRPSGRFYDSHHKLGHKNGGAWRSLRFNSEYSPFVTTKWLKEREIESGGRDSVEYQIRVLGLFPEQTEKYLVGRSAIEKCIGAPPVIKPGEAYGNLLIIDVSAGVYRDNTVATHARVFGSGDRIDEEPRRVDFVDVPIFSNALDWDDVAGRAFHYAQELSNCTILVDVGGQGIQFAKKLEKLGAPNVIKVNWGKPCFKNRNKDRFFNERAQCSVHAAEAVKDGRVTFSEKRKSELLDQGSRIPYFFDEKARYHIQPKEQMKTDGIPSPDLWDTVCMAFLEGAHYIQADVDIGVANLDAADAARARARAELAEMDD